jgi:hypothetical protein
MRKTAALLTALVLLIAIALLLSVMANIGGNGSNGGVTLIYNPYSQSGTWYKGQLHCHSDRSDGWLAPADVVSKYDELGYDFLALTDHRKVTLVQGSILVLGQEYNKGSVESGLRTHMNGINVSVPPRDLDSTQERVDNIVGQAGVAILNHPNRFPYRYSESVLDSLTGYTGIEVVNRRDVDPGAFKMWDNALRSGKRVWGVATDDAHKPSDYNSAWVMVRVPGELTTASVVNALKDGSFYATQGPVISDISTDGRYLNITSPGADEVRFFGPEQKLLATIEGGNVSYDLQGAQDFVRAQVVVGELSAWTQPMFLGKGNVAGQATNDMIERPVTGSTFGQMVTANLNVMSRWGSIHEPS